MEDEEFELDRTWEEVEALVAKVLTPEEMAIRREVIMGIVQLERYLGQLF